MTLRSITLVCTLACAGALCSAVQAAGPRIAVGADFVLVSRTDGTVWAWGQGVDGQLGNGLRTSSSHPVQVTGLSGVVDVVAADSLAAALKADGTVWVWGHGANGIFGSTRPDNTIRASTPVMIPQLSEVHALALGHDGAAGFAADSRGRVFHWGNNYRGQAGDGTASNNGAVLAVPRQVPGLADITVLAAADDGFMAGAFGASVSAWGANESGALGVAQRSTRGGAPLAVQPVAGVSDLLGIAALDINDNAWFAVQRDGSVAAWGTNRSWHASCGQVPTSTPVLTEPRTVAGLAGVLGQAGGAAHALFINGQGQVLGCGSNSSGQLGDGSTTGADSARPGPLAAALSVPAVAVGAGRATSAAVALDGSVWVWGQLSQGAAGDGGTAGGMRVALQPQRVVAASGGAAFSAGVGDQAAALYTGTQTGPLSRATVDVGLSPLPGDVGREARLYLAALLPDGTLWLYSPAGGWQAPAGGSLPVFMTGVLTRHVAARIFTNSDLRGTAGIQLLLGYGLGSTDAQAASDLLARGTYGAALTLAD